MKKFLKKSAVYWIKDANGDIIYVGSTKNLKQRMSYHKWATKTSDKYNANNALYLFLANNEYTVNAVYLDNYKEAEMAMINKHNPKFNRHRVTSVKDLNLTSAQEDYAAYHREYLQANKQYNEEHKKYCAEWNRTHKEYFKAYREAHKESK